MKKRVENMKAFLSVLAIALMLAAVPVAAEEPEYRSVPFVWYFLYGSSYGECNANCMASCMPACGAAAASAEIDASACGGECGSKCGGTCASVFTTTVSADDGLPQVPHITDGHLLDGIGINVDGQTPKSNLPEAGVTVGSQSCPAKAPDGHPMAWDPVLGCYDLNWKDDYCGMAMTCNHDRPCTAMQGCMWNGAACVPCRAPTCIYSCPDRPGQVAQQQDLQNPHQFELPEQHIPTGGEQTGGAQQGGAAQGGAQGGAQPSATASPTPTATPLPTPRPSVTPTPAPYQLPVQCSALTSCSDCVKAAKKDGESQCGWSEFFNACLDAHAWNAINSSYLKAGWTTEQRYCPKERVSYCFQYNDCFSCAGFEGLKRKCQWSTEKNACVPYDPVSKFKTEAKDGPNIILPQLCAEHDCSQYDDCLQCVKNAACLWTRDSEECVPFEGNGDSKLYYFYPGNCRVEATPTPVPTICSAGCTCNENSRLLACNSRAVNSSKLLLVDRAAANAGAAASMQQIDSIEFNQDGVQAYVVRGHKSANFLFLIPVQIDLTATVNAQTGAVEKIDAPWWSFLAG